MLWLKEATRKGSPAEQAGCKDGVKLKLVGGHLVQAMPKQEVLRLLTADHNMIVGEGFNIPCAEQRHQNLELTIQHDIDIID